MLDPPRRQCLADDARGNPLAVNFDGRHDVDREIAARPFRSQQVRRSGALVAEAEVEADRRSGNAEPAQQDIVDEILRLGLGQRRIELEHNRAGEAGRREQAQLGPFVGEAEQRLPRPQEPARMRLERQRDRRPAEQCRALLRRRDHRAVTAMHAVEIADRHHRAGKRGVRPGAVDDHEVVRLAFDHQLRLSIPLVSSRERGRKGEEVLVNRIFKGIR